VTRPERVLAFVAAHPDDDVMGAAGIVALRRDDPSFRFVLIHATDGEAGKIAASSGVSREQLGPVRREEDRAGWDILGRQPDRHEWFGLPDGGLAALPDGLLEQRIASVFAEERPDVVITFGPDGITGRCGDPVGPLRGALTTRLPAASPAGEHHAECRLASTTQRDAAPGAGASRRWRWPDRCTRARLTS
jgi:hypothetical protein